MFWSYSLPTLEPGAHVIEFTVWSDMKLTDGLDENGDGQLAIEAHASPKSPDPNVILNGFWVFPDNVPAPITEAAILHGDLPVEAELQYTEFMGGGESNSGRDRDNVGLNVKYSF